MYFLKNCKIPYCHPLHLDAFFGYVNGENKRKREVRKKQGICNLKNSSGHTNCNINHKIVTWNIFQDGLATGLFCLLWSPYFFVNSQKLIALRRILFISQKKRKILFSECTGLLGTGILIHIPVMCIKWKWRHSVFLIDLAYTMIIS